MWACVNDAAGCPFDAVSINPSVVLGEVMCKMHTKSSAVLLRQAIYNNPVLNYPASYVDVTSLSLWSAAYSHPTAPHDNSRALSSASTPTPSADTYFTPYARHTHFPKTHHENLPCDNPPSPDFICILASSSSPPSILSVVFFMIAQLKYCHNFKVSYCHMFVSHRCKTECVFSTK